MPSLRKKGEVWYACIALPNGKRTQISTKKRDKGSPAERSATHKQAMLIAQSLEELALGDPTEAHIRKTLNHLFERVGNRSRVSRPLNVFFDEWLQRVKLHLAPNTHSRYKGIADSFLAGLGGRRTIPLTEVTIGDIQAWIDGQLTKGKRVSSVHSAWQTLGIPFAGALKQGLIPANPVPLAEVPRFSRQPSRFPFSGAQIAEIIRTAEGDWRTASLLGAFTGARIGDVCGMRWGSVDLQLGILRYLPEKTRRIGAEIVIPIHPILLEHLVDLRRRQPASCDRLCPALAVGPRNGRPVVASQFKAILRKAGIQTEELVAERGGVAPIDPAGSIGRPSRHKVSRYSFHSFRHSFASMLANAGVPRELRMQLIGHTTDHIHSGYSHLAFETMRGAVMQLPAFVAVTGTAVPVSKPKGDALPKMSLTDASDPAGSLAKPQA